MPPCARVCGRAQRVAALKWMEIETRAARLQRMRESRGMTRQQLAGKLGIPVNTLEALESGGERPSRELRRALMAYFDCQFEDLFQVVAVNAEGDRA